MSDWQHQARCVDNPALFDTPDPEDRGSAKLTRERAATSICLSQCPVRRQCLEASLMFETQSTAYNVRGGMTPDERKALLRNRTRNRKKEMADA